MTNSISSFRSLSHPTSEDGSSFGSFSPPTFEDEKNPPPQLLSHPTFEDGSSFGSFFPPTFEDEKNPPPQLLSHPTFEDGSSFGSLSLTTEDTQKIPSLPDASVKRASPGSLSLTTFEDIERPHSFRKKVVQQQPPSFTAQAIDGYYQSLRMEHRTLDERAKQFVDEAIIFNKANQPDDALKAIEKGIVLQPSAPVLGLLYKEKITAFASRNEYMKISEVVQKGIALMLQNSDLLAFFYTWKAVGYGRKENYEDAILAADTGIALNPQNKITLALLYLQKATASNHIGQYDDAIIATTEAIALVPQNKNPILALLYLQKAIAHYHLQQYNNAFNATNKGIPKTDPMVEKDLLKKFIGLRMQISQKMNSSKTIIRLPIFSPSNPPKKQLQRSAQGKAPSVPRPPNGRGIKRSAQGKPSSNGSKKRAITSPTLSEPLESLEKNAILALGTLRNPPSLSPFFSKKMGPNIEPPSPEGEGFLLQHYL